jgi:hypothetical protein
MGAPAILYKYRSWDNEFHRRMLLFNEIYFTNPKNFNDPLDYRVTPDFSLLSTQEKIEEYVKINIDSSHDLLVKRGKSIEETYSKFNQEFGNLELLQERYDGINNETLDFHGVFSISELWNNFLMWSHYGNDHKGFVIGFNANELFAQTCFNGFIGPVLYYTHYPRINPLEGDTIGNFIKACVIKSDVWAYEKEYRLGKVFYPNKPSDQQRTFRVFDNAIAEVIIGSEAEPKTIEEISFMCKCRNIPVYRAIKAKKKFELTREQI